MPLSQGTTAPSISTLDQDGNAIQPDLNTLTVLFFYPKDDTAGCTKEACEFRDDASMFADLNAQVFGISTDDAASHKAFIEKYDLNFTLLVDDNQAISTAYDVLRDSGLANRVTFLIKDGVIQKVFDKVNPVGHSAEVQEAIKGLS